MWFVEALLAIAGMLFFFYDAVIQPTQEKPSRIRFFSLGILCWFILYCIPIFVALSRHKVE